MNSALAATLWGGLAASSLVIGGALALRFRLPVRLVGLILAFGAGTLISAVAYELVPDVTVDAAGVAIAMGAGAIAFYLGNDAVSRMGGGKRKDLNADRDAPSGGSGGAIVLGTILDGIPESLVLGIGLTVGGAVSVAFLGAVFISNLPEAIAATVSGLAAGAGYVIASSLGSDGTLIQAFAAGALLTMIIDTMAPEAVEQAGSKAGLATVLGFAVAAALSGLE